MTRTRSLIVRAVVAFAAGTLLLAGPLSSSVMAAAADQADAVETFERDVYVIVGVTLRNPDATTDPAAPLFNIAGVRLESPSGDPLTWGEWQAASATSTARTQGRFDRRHTDVRLELGGLVPGGLYSVFWGTLQPDSEHPLCPGVERTLPLDAANPKADAPAPNAFVASASGAADFKGTAGAPLLDAGQVFFSVVYHAFGEVAYPFPNLGELSTQGQEQCRSSFGEDAMRHVLVLQKW